MTRAAVIGFLAAQSVLLAGAVRAQELVIEHQPVGCVVAGQCPVFTARLQPTERVARSRVYFRAHNTPHWYFVEMKVDAGAYTGTLPAPKKDIESVDYYIEATDEAFVSARTADFAPRVVESAGACKDLLLAAANPSAKVMVGSEPGAPAMPPGFSPAGVNSLGATAGTAAAGQPEAAGGAAASAGGSSGIPTGWIIGGVAVAGTATAAVIIASKSSGVPAPAKSCLALPGDFFEISACSDINLKARAGCPMTLQFGVGRWPTAAEATRALAGATGAIMVDGVALPVTYEGITLHRGGGEADGYGNRVRAVWTPTIGSHLLTASWSIDPDNVVGCQCSVTQ
jgi:hypothetical protein